jgi:cell division protein FtsB
MGRARTQIAVVAAVFVTLSSGWIAYDPKGLRLWWHLGQDVSQLDHQNSVLAAQVDSLQRKAAALRQDPHALERAARESGYVRENEILIELK